jgi:acetate kinase
MRELTAAYPIDPRARLAVDVFCYRARKYLGAYLAVLAGTAQAVIFSGGIGENAPQVRKMILEGMEWCGLSLDAAENAQVIGRDRKISASKSQLDIFVVHTDEETVIAQETTRIIGI